MGMTYYDDVGEVYKFGLLADDVWKKEDVFGLFSTRLVRMIALEVGVPVEKVGWGKWGGRIYVGDEKKETVEEWANKIENHPTYEMFKEVCKLATYRKDGTKEQEQLFES